MRMTRQEVILVVVILVAVILGAVTNYMRHISRVPLAVPTPPPAHSPQPHYLR